MSISTYMYTYTHTHTHTHTHTRTHRKTDRQNWIDNRTWCEDWNRDGDGLSTYGDVRRWACIETDRHRHGTWRVKRRSFPSLKIQDLPWVFNHTVCEKLNAVIILDDDAGIMNRKSVGQRSFRRAYCILHTAYCTLHTTYYILHTTYYYYYSYNYYY